MEHRDNEYDGKEGYLNALRDLAKDDMVTYDEIQELHAAKAEAVLKKQRSDLVKRMKRKIVEQFAQGKLVDSLN